MSTKSTTRHSSVKVAIPAAGIGLLALTACGDPHEVPEEHSSWELVDTVKLEAIDSTNDIYVEGSFRTFFGTGSGEVESRQVIDYKYAEMVDEHGGMQEQMLSDHFESFPKDSYYKDGPARASFSGGDGAGYPGSDIVTIYQTPDEDNPRIETYYCEVDEDYLDEAGGFWGPPSYYSCEGSYSGGERDLLLRHELHVPEGSVIQTFDEQAEEVEQ